MQQVDYLARRLAHPGQRIRSQQQHLAHLHARLARSAFHALRQADLHLAATWHRLGAAAPDMAGLRARYAHQGWQLLGAMQQAQERRGLLLTRLAAHLTALSPQRVLERGYAIVAHSDGGIVRVGADLALGEEVSLTFARGGAQARISRTRT
jgi:exodeoxyribonuclease VII large subunit